MNRLEKIYLFDHDHVTVGYGYGRGRDTAGVRTPSRTERAPGSLDSKSAEKSGGRKTKVGYTSSRGGLCFPVRGEITFGGHSYLGYVWYPHMA